jgi:hypothetical protein
VALPLLLLQVPPNALLRALSLQKVRGSVALHRLLTYISSGRHAVPKSFADAPPFRLASFAEESTDGASSFGDNILSRVSSCNSEVADLVLSRTSSVNSELARTSSNDSVWSRTSTASTRYATKNVQDAARSALGAASWLLETVERERRIHASHDKNLTGIRAERAIQARAAVAALETVVDMSGQGHRRKTARIASS